MSLAAPNAVYAIASQFSNQLQKPRFNVLAFD
jgi:hypothetical protein